MSMDLLDLALRDWGGKRYARALMTRNANWGIGLVTGLSEDGLVPRRIPRVKRLIWAMRIRGGYWSFDTTGIVGFRWMNLTSFMGVILEVGLVLPTVFLVAGQAFRPYL
jgi:hypothetical protein